MYNPWVDFAMLALESGRVMSMRVMALGGPGAQAETERMVSEKMVANAAATVTLLTGGSLEMVIAGYREVVQANADRLLDSAARLPGLV